MNKYIFGTVFLFVLLVSPSLTQAQVLGDVAPQGAQQVSDCIDIQNNLSYRSRDVNTNGEVSLLQSFLQDKGLLSDDPTGFFGKKTYSAVKKFQSSISLLSSGYVGPMTRAKIKNLTCSGGAEVTSVKPAQKESLAVKTSGTLSIARGPHDPSSDNIVLAGSSGVMVGEFSFSAQGSSYTVQNLAVIVPNTIANPAASSIASITIKYKDKNGVTQSVVQPLAVMPSSTVARAYFTGLAMYVPANDSANLGVYVDTPTIASGAISGSAINVTIDTSVDTFRAMNEYGTIAVPSTVSPNAKGVSSGGSFYVRKSVPIIAKINNTSDSIPATGSPLYRFSVSAENSGSIDWSRVSFNVNGTAGISLTNLYLVDDANYGNLLDAPVAYPTPASQVVFDLSKNVTQAPYQQVGPGMKKSYSLYGTVSGFGTGSSLTISLASDTQPSAQASAGAVSGAFVWSDRSSFTHSTASSDWANGYLLKDFTGYANYSKSAIIQSPTVVLSVSTSTVPQGSSAIITWSTTNATSCLANSVNGKDFDWMAYSANNGKPSGSVSVTPTTTSTYEIICIDASTGQTVLKTSTIIVVPTSAPTASVTIDRSSLTDTTGKPTITGTATNMSSLTVLISTTSGASVTSGTSVVSSDGHWLYKSEALGYGTYKVTIYGSSGGPGYYAQGTLTVSAPTPAPTVSDCTVSDVYAVQVPGFVYYNLYMKVNHLPDSGTTTPVGDVAITGADSWNNLKFNVDGAYTANGYTLLKANQTINDRGASYILGLKNTIRPISNGPKTITCKSMGQVSLEGSKQSQLASALSAFDSTASAVSTSQSQPSFSYVWNTNLSVGSMYSADITALQTALSKEGVYTGAITGGFYNQTLLAVKAFQQKYGIEATGYVGPDTRAKLNALY